MNRMAGEALDDLVRPGSAQRAAEALAVGEGHHADQVPLRRDVVAPAQIGHRLMGQLHVPRQIRGEARLDLGGRAVGEALPLDQPAAAGDRAGAGRGRRRSVVALALGPVDLAPGGERADIILHGPGDAAEQDVVLDSLLLELRQQLSALRAELEQGEQNDHEQQRNDAGRGEPRVFARQDPLLERRHVGMAPGRPAVGSEGVG
jgi:hypothetical protein